jgi:hypothetical protein
MASVFVMFCNDIHGLNHINNKVKMLMFMILRALHFRFTVMSFPVVTYLLYFYLYL